VQAKRKMIVAGASQGLLLYERRVRALAKNQVKDVKDMPKATWKPHEKHGRLTNAE
jgi:hypothetical protein